MSDPSGFLSDEQRRTVEEAIGVLQQLRSASATHVHHSSNDAVSRTQAPLIASQLPPQQSPAPAPTAAVSSISSSIISTRLPSRLPAILDGAGPSSSGLQNLTQSHHLPTQGCY